MKIVGAAVSAVLRTLIRLYQVAIGPLFPRVCRFEPTCSSYALEAIGAHGPVKGLGLSAWRLLRCHPFHPGGYDPVPVHHSCIIPNPGGHGEHGPSGGFACSAGKNSE
jgi:hypothetical protein